MNEQSPVNFFTLNGNRTQQNSYNIFNNSTAVPTNNMVEQNIAPSVKTAELDEELKKEGLKIDSQMSQESKQSYVDSLTQNQYQKMLQYKDAGYSFEASKALIQAEQLQSGGGYRGEGFQINQPVGGAFNLLNPVGLITEKIDDYIQTHITDFDDGDDENFSFTTMLKNIPGSALKTASAVTRGLTNPLDTLLMLKDLVFTEEGRGVLKERYGGWDNILNTLEKDPVGLASDVLTIVEGGAGVVAKAGSMGAKLAGAGSKAGAKLSKVAGTAGKIGGTAGTLSDLGIRIPYNNLLDSSLNKLAQGGKLSQRAGQYLSLTQRPIDTIFKGATPDAKGGLFPGINDKVSNIINRAKENIQSTATGLTQEVKDRIRNNPYVGEYWRQTEEMINREGASMEPQKIIEGPIQEIGNELIQRLDEYESRLNENGPAYQRLKATTRQHDLSSAKSQALGVFSRNQISLNPDGSLRFGNMILPSDMNPVTTAWQLIQKTNWSKMTANDYLNLRSQLSDLAKFESGTTTKGTKVIKELRNQINQIAHKEIPGLDKVDKLYSTQIKDIGELKKGLVYQQGSRKGEVRDNFYSIIKNMNTSNRRQMAKRLEKIFPDLTARVEAINMLPKLVNAYQNSPQMMKTLFKATGALTGLSSGQGAIRTAMGYIVGIVLDEFLSKPLGEKWRKLAIDKLLQETTPEAQQLLTELASKMRAGIDLTANERRTLELAIQEIINGENEYLNGQRLEERERENSKLRLPEPKPDVVGDNGVSLGEGRALRQPEPYNLKHERTTEVKEIQEDLNIDKKTANKVSDTIEDFLDEIGANDGQINPREVNYSKFSTKSLNELYQSNIPQSEKAKIEKELNQRDYEVKDPGDDQYYAYKINQLEEEEQRIGKVGKNKVGKEYTEQQRKQFQAKKDKIIKELEQVYFDNDPDSANKAVEKYDELRDKPIEYINDYKKTDSFVEEQSERVVLDRILDEWNKQPKFVRSLSEKGIQERNSLLSNELNNGYKFDNTEYNDRLVKDDNGQIVNKGAIKYDENGKVEVVIDDFNELLESGLLTRLPEDAEIRISGEADTVTAGELVGDYQYQKVGVANPNERTITAEEGLSIRNFKNGRSVREIMEDYGVSEEIVDKIVTEKGEQALGRYKDQLIELASLIKEGTAPHELFHAVFDLVDNGRKEEILKIVQERKGMSRKDANEWLADRFSEYFRTGKFDTKTAPKGFLGKIRNFFDKVRDFVKGVYREKVKVKQLFDDILDNKIETDMESIIDSINNWIDNGEWSDKNYNKFKESVKRDPEAEYQIIQESLFAEPKKQFTEKEMNDAFDKHRPKLEAVIDRIGTSKNRNSSYSPIRIAYSILESYSPDVNKWIENINHDITLTKSKWITPAELTGIYHALEQFMKDPEMKAWVEYNYNNNGHLGKQLFDMMKNIENNPLEIPEEYKMSDSLQKLNDTLYDNLDRATINNLIGTYDPDPIEWKYNINKALKSTTSEYLTLNKLYNIKNMVQDFINGSGDKPVAGTFDDTGIQKLVDLEKEGKNKKVSSYDNEQITKVGEELGSQLVKFNQDTIDVLGDLYNPDVDKWQSNLVKVRSIRKQYSEIRVPHTNVLTTLKSKLIELSKYSPEEIKEVFGEDDQASKNLYKFVKEVKDKEAKLSAEGTTKAVTNLVALHNMDIKNFERQIKNFNGKSPMPSIAVMDPNVPHEVFGDLTLIFGKDTINPKVDERNKIYGSDAWTPMFPDIKEVGGLKYDEVKKFVDDAVDSMIDKGVDLDPSEAGYLANDIRNLILELDDREDLQTKSSLYAEEIIEDLYGGGYEDFISNNDGAVIELQGKIEDFLYNVDTGKKQVIPGRYFEDGIDRPLEPENVVEAMKNQRVNREVQPGSFRDMIEIEGHELNDVEDVKRQNFAKVFHGDWTGDLGDLEHRYDSLIKLIAEDNNRLNGNTPDNNNVVEDIKYEIKNAYDPDVTKFREKLNEAYPDTPLEDGTVGKPIFREDILQRIIDVVEQGKKIPIRFSESKPERVVDLYKEVQYVLVPSGDFKKAQKIVEGTELEGKLVEYTPDNHTAPRSRKIKELQKRYGNIFFQMGGVVMPIAMLLQAVNNIQGDDEETA